MKHVCHNKRKVRVVELDCKKTLESLTPTERLYAHHSARAFFEGALLVFLQTSRRSAGVFILLYRLFSTDSIGNLKQKAHNVGFTDVGWKEFLGWAASAISIGGGCPMLKKKYMTPLKRLVKRSAAATMFPDFLQIYKSIVRAVFFLSPRAAPDFASTEVEKKKQQLIPKKIFGLCCGFFCSEMQENNAQLTPKEISDLCNSAARREGLLRANMQFCREEVGGERILKINVASTIRNTIDASCDGIEVRVQTGHFAEILEQICMHLDEAIQYGASEKQKQMLEHCVEYLKTGEKSRYKRYDKLWSEGIEDVVTSRIRFEENTTRPPGKRSEFSGFVAALNREKNEKFARLVENAAGIRKKLPWAEMNAFERDHIAKPDFVPLDVIAFRFNEDAERKGVHFGENENGMDHCHLYTNIISALPMTTTHIKDEDKVLLREHHYTAQDASTALHELFGHGSGKILKEDSKGNLNFTRQTTKDLLTGETVESWYKPGQRFSSVFGALATPFEECRAYAVALTLVCETEVLELMGFDADSGQNVKYVTWLIQLRDGLRSLAHYDVSRGIWMDGHAHARFVLLKVLLAAGEGCLTIEKVKDSSGKVDLIVNLDRDKMDSVGLPAVRQFLLQLQTFKSTANVKAATELFDQYSVGPKEMNWRSIVLRNNGNEPKLIFLQPNIQVKDGQAELVTYPETSEGVIQSVIDRYSPESIQSLEQLWKAEQQHAELHL